MVQSTEENHILRYGVIFCAVMVLALFVNVCHAHLWGPDEPREAEIAREACVSGEYVYSTFNGIPFVEKPPLYYDLVAGAFALTGGANPGAARMVSALLGVLMTGALYGLARRRLGTGGAALAAALLVSMPQFYRATHWILLDIGAGAFITTSLAIYGYWVLHPEKRESNAMLALFYLAAAAAFLTKGVITLVYLGMVILPFMVYKRRWLPFRMNWTILFFLLPVAGWIWLFYQKGGVFFLHEHFVNNIFGRLLHREFRLPGSPIIISDVGHATRWSFYLERLPNMFGAAILFIVPTLVAGVLTLRQKALHIAAKKDVWYSRLADRIFAPFPARDRDWICYLLLWSFLPILLFSIPAIKEVTYLLPSYAGLALFIAEYWQSHFSAEACQFGKAELLALSIPVAGTALATQILAPVSIPLAVTLSIFAMVAGLGFAKSSTRFLFAVLGVLIAAVILGNTPALMLRSRLARKCYCALAEDVWRHVGNRELFLYGGDESIRGALPFYGNRKLTVLPRWHEALKIAQNLSGRVLIMTVENFELLQQKDRNWAELLPRLAQYRPEYPKLADEFVVLTEPESAEN